MTINGQADTDPWLANVERTSEGEGGGDRRVSAVWHVARAMRSVERRATEPFQNQGGTGPPDKIMPRRPWLIITD